MDNTIKDGNIKVPRWYEIPSPRIAVNEAYQVKRDESFSVYFQALTGDNANWNGIYLNVAPGTVSITLRFIDADTFNFQDLFSAINSGEVVKMTGIYPTGPGSPSPPANPLAGTVTVWQAGILYEKDDLVFHETDFFTKYYRSALYNNIQSRWDAYFRFQGPSPVNKLGMFTIPTGKLENMHLASRAKGSPYWAWDKQRLYIHPGIENIDMDQDAAPFGFLQAISNVIPDWEEGRVYDVGDVVHGHLNGRYGDSVWLRQVWGIFRRDMVNIWNRVRVEKFYTDGSPQYFAAGFYFYIDDFPGLNGIYQVGAENVSMHLITGDTAEFQSELDSGKFARVTPPPSNAPVQPFDNEKIYMRGDRVFFPDVYESIFICNYNGFRSSLSDTDALNFDLFMNEQFLGWVCLADLSAGEDSTPDQRSAFIRILPNRNSFPDPGREDTLYVDAFHDRLYFWQDGTGYILISQDMPYLKSMEFFTGAEAAISWEEVHENEEDNIHHGLSFESLDDRLLIQGTIPDPDYPNQYQIEFDWGTDYIEDMAFTTLDDGISIKSTFVNELKNTDNEIVREEHQLDITFEPTEAIKPRINHQHNATTNTTATTIYMENNLVSLRLEDFDDDFIGLLDFTIDVRSANHFAFIMLDMEGTADPDNPKLDPNRVFVTEHPYDASQHPVDLTDVLRQGIRGLPLVLADRNPYSRGRALGISDLTLVLNNTQDSILVIFDIIGFVAQLDYFCKIRYGIPMSNSSPPIKRVILLTDIISLFRFAVDPTTSPNGNLMISDNGDERLLLSLTDVEYGNYPDPSPPLTPIDFGLETTTVRADLLMEILFAGEGVEITLVGNEIHIGIEQVEYPSTSFTPKQLPTETVDMDYDPRSVFDLFVAGSGMNVTLLPTGVVMISVAPLNV
jgi:hypothetical protein